MNAQNSTSVHRTPIPSAAVAWAFLLLLLPPMACSGTASTTSIEEAPAAQGDLIARLPAEATTVGYIDFTALRNSPVYEYLKQERTALGDPGALEDLIGQTGIDPRNDLHRIAFVSGNSVVRPDLSSSGVIVVASFDRARVLEALGEQEPEQYEGHDLYTLASWRLRLGDSASDDDQADDDESDDDESDDDEADDGESDDDRRLRRGYMTILDDSTLAFGGGETIRRIIDVARGAASARTNQELMGLLEDVDPDSQLWTVSAHRALLGDLSAPAGTPLPQIPVDRIDALILSIHLTDGVAMKLRGRTAEQADAKLLGDSLNGMLAFGKMMLQSRTPEIFEILDRGISAGSSGRDVTVRADLSMEDIEALRQYAEKTIGDSEAA